MAGGRYDRPMVTIQSIDVKRPTTPKTVLNRATCVPSLLGCAGHEHKKVHPLLRRELPPPRRLEALSPSDSNLVDASDANAFGQAAHDAFFEHYPLRLTPDSVWFCIAQGFAHHVALNAESLRKRFVRHEGKKTLVVERADFSLGRPNPWPEAFSAFSTQIAGHVGKLRDLVVADFSTTGPTERAASEVLLMDTFQAYFEYEMRAGCGIPEFELLGTPEDWLRIRRRTSMLSEFGLEWWTKPLLPVLDAIIDSVEGRPDDGFWRSFFRYDSSSMGCQLTGWILVLFPYLKEFSRTGERIAPNPYLSRWEKALRKAESASDWRSRTGDGPSIGALPSTISSAPVKFTDVRDGAEHALRFVAGFFGVAQDPSTLALSPEFGWAIVEEITPAV